MALGMGKQQNRLFGMIYDAIGKAGLVVQNECNMVAAGNVFGGNHREFIPMYAAAEGDASDFAARNLAAYGSPVEHTGHGDVVYVAGASGDFVAALLARNRRSDNVRLGQGLRRPKR